MRRLILSPVESSYLSENDEGVCNHLGKKKYILRKSVIGSLEIWVVFLLKVKQNDFSEHIPRFPPHQLVAFNETEGLYDHHRDPIVKLKEPRTFKELVTYVPFDIRDLDDGWLRYHAGSEVVRWWGEFFGYDPIYLEGKSTWNIMEPENHPFAKVNHLPKPRLLCSKCEFFPGCSHRIYRIHGTGIFIFNIRYKDAPDAWLMYGIFTV